MSETRGQVFPDLRRMDPKQDFYATGGDMRPAFLIEAYRKGIFPWPNPDLAQLLWASPSERGILDFSKLHVGRSLAKFFRKQSYSVSFNHCFEEVISLCRAVPRAGQQGTWITSDLERSYFNFHQLGFAHSVEVWLHHRLVGGLYGVSVDGMFSAESMFHLEDNASKFAIVQLIEHLRKQGLGWMDIQVLTPVTEALGGELIPRADFLDRLASSRDPGRLLWEKKTQT